MCESTQLKAVCKDISNKAISGIMTWSMYFFMDYSIIDPIMGMDCCKCQ